LLDIGVKPIDYIFDGKLRISGEIFSLLLLSLVLDPARAGSSSQLLAPSSRSFPAVVGEDSSLDLPIISSGNLSEQLHHFVISA
jgi:hypothetical protein